MASIPIPKRLGGILLGIWLILTELMLMPTGLVIPTWIMGLLAIFAGIFVILDR